MKIKDFIWGVIAAVVFAVIMGGCIWSATSAESWYAGMHDAECENTLRGEKCYCYERFIESDKERTGK